MNEYYVLFAIFLITLTIQGNADPWDCASNKSHFTLTNEVCGFHIVESGFFTTGLFATAGQCSNIATMTRPVNITVAHNRKSRD